MMNKEVKLPKLNKNERKYYDEIKQAENGDKKNMVLHVLFNGKTHYPIPEDVDEYRILHAILEGGYAE